MGVRDWVHVPDRRLELETRARQGLGGKIKPDQDEN